MSSLSCRQCGQPITFDNNHISQRTGKKIPLDIETNYPHDCPVRKSQQQRSNKYSRHNKGDIINVTKAAAS